MNRRMKRLLGQVLPQQVAVQEQREANAIMAVSKSEFVPVKTGTLRSTGLVMETVFAPLNITTEMRYGGGNAAKYAVPVHEKPGSFENPTKPGTGPKYLEQPAFQAVPGMADRMARGIKL